MPKKIKTKDKKKKLKEARKKQHAAVQKKASQATHSKKLKKNSVLKKQEKNNSKKTTNTKVKVGKKHNKNVKKIAKVDTTVIENIKKPTFFQNINNKLSSLLLILIGFGLTVFISWFFIGKLLEPINLAKILPLDETVLLLDFDQSKLKNEISLEQIREENRFNINNIITELENALGADFNKDVMPWLGEQHGYALLNDNSEDSSDNYLQVVFIETINKQMTLDFLQRFKLSSHHDFLKQEKYNNYSFYTFEIGQNISFLVLDKYFIFSKSTDALKAIVDVRRGEKKALNKGEVFNKVRNNLKSDFGFVYFVPEKLYNFYLKDHTMGSSSFIMPVISLFNGQGHSFIFDNNSLVVQTYMSVNAGKDRQTLSRFNQHYKADLLDIFPANHEYFWGSRNASKSVSDLGFLLNNLYPSSFNILEGVLNAKKEQYFGYDIDLRDDIYPIFENEFALGLYAQPEKIDYLFIAKDQNKEIVSKLQAYYLETMTKQGYEVLNNEMLVDVSEVIIEEDEDVESITVEGATESVAVEASTQSVTVEPIISNEIEIAVFPFDSRSNIYTLYYNNYLIISTNKELINTTVSNIDNKNTPFTKTITINKYLKDFDEVNIMSPAFISELFGKNMNLYLDGVSSIQAAKSIFTDGIALVHIFEF